VRVGEDGAIAERARAKFHAPGIDRAELPCLEPLHGTGDRRFRCSLDVREGGERLVRSRGEVAAEIDRPEIAALLEPGGESVAA
jgi:hypothetical protein